MSIARATRMLARLSVPQRKRYKINHRVNITFGALQAKNGLVIEHVLIVGDQSLRQR